MWFNSGLICSILHPISESNIGLYRGFNNSLFNTGWENMGVVIISQLKVLLWELNSSQVKFHIRPELGIRFTRLWDYMRPNGPC